MENKKYNITKPYIETAVAEFYKIKVEDIYCKGKHCYPVNGARMALVWLLYSNGFKSYVISEFLGITERRVFKMAATVCVELKSDTKLKEDIDSINEKLKNK